MYSATRRTSPAPTERRFPSWDPSLSNRGAWTARNILAEIAGKERTPFDYKDKGIMAMIGRKAAVAEMGAHRHEVDGPVAFAAWLGVHAMLLSGVRNKIDAFIAWGWDYFSKNGATAIVGAPEAGRIDWGDDDEGET
jgi:NADH dehydrogenase